MLQLVFVAFGDLPETWIQTEDFNDRIWNEGYCSKFTKYFNLISLQSCLMSNKVILFYSGFTVISRSLRDLSVLSYFDAIFSWDLLWLTEDSQMWHWVGLKPLNRWSRRWRRLKLSLFSQLYNNLWTNRNDYKIIMRSRLISKYVLFTGRCGKGK